MKHIIILGDGMADHAVERLGGKTLLQYANKPYMDMLAKKGKTGRLVTVPDGFHPGSEVANSSIMGYDQNEVYEGRGPLEAASIGYEMSPNDFALRCNIINVNNGIIVTHNGGNLETEDADVLIKYLNEKLASQYPGIVKFITGIQYRHLLIIKGGNKYVDCAPPHDHPNEEWKPLLVKPMEGVDEALLAGNSDKTPAEDAAENGGITDDNYITHPESYDDQFSENEIPTVLSKNWNRNNSNHLFFSHRYNIGFYKRVALTEAEKKARAFAKASAQDRKQRDNLRNNQDGDDANGNKRRNNKRTTDPVATGRPDGARIAGDLPKTGEKPADPDSTRIQVTSQQMADSLLAVQHRKDSLDANTKRIYVPVTSFIHTLDINSFSRINQAYASPAGYYANTYYKYDDRGIYGNDSIYDQTKYLSVKNTFAVALMEGFNKYAKAGLKVFVSYDHRKYQMPDLLQEGDEGYYMRSWSEGLVSVGGQLSKTQGRTLHYNLDGEFFLTGSNAGSVSLNFNTDVNFPLFGDTVRLAAKAHFDRITPTFFQRQYHSKHLWWDNGDMSKEIRSGIEGIFTIDKTHTQLRVAVEEIKNYTYFGMEYAIDEKHNFTGLQGGVYQEGGNINLLTAQLRQNFKLGPLHWENIVTYQNSSNKDVLPVPTVNIFTNLFFKFLVVKQLTVELGADATFFTKYYAPDYLPQIGQFAVQKNVESRVELGGYPFVDVYANMHLKRTRFFVMMSHVNKGMGNKMMFLAPHYPQNGKVLRIGVSWNFYN